jgi:hypothetical protein
MVCRQKSGNAKTFQCPYHAWTYNSRGQLIGVPGEDSYSEAFKREDMALVAPPKVDNYRALFSHASILRRRPYMTIWRERVSIWIWSPTSLKQG